MQKMRLKFFIFLVTVITLGTSLSPSISQAKNYLSGEILQQQSDENDRVFYQTRLEDGNLIDLDSYGEELKIGDKVYVEILDDGYNFLTVKRSFATIILFIIFVVGIIWLAKKKGVRALVSLGISMLLLLGVFIPLLLKGLPPMPTSIVFGILVLALGIFVTHGFTRQSLVSFLGSLASIGVAVLMVEFVVTSTSLSGLINDSIQFLGIESSENLDLVRIVTASIVIGILGVLDDITVTQVAVVRELSSDSNLSKKDIFKKAVAVGQDHIASLVNTIVFAYVGASLPMIMFITLIEIPAVVLINQEFVFMEIVRSLVGATALTLAVPITTYLAVYLFLPSIKKDALGIESACAHHHH